MNKPSSLIWMVFIFLLILPTPAGKFVLDLVGGIFVIITLIPIILGGVGWLTWKRIKSKMKTCETCGSNFLISQVNCPICGTTMKNITDVPENIPASAATIDIKSENIDF